MDENCLDFKKLKNLRHLEDSLATEKHDWIESDQKNAELSQVSFQFFFLFLMFDYGYCDYHLSTIAETTKSLINRLDDIPTVSLIFNRLDSW